MVYAGLYAYSEAVGHCSDLCTHHSRSRVLSLLTSETKHVYMSPCLDFGKRFDYRKDLPSACSKNHFFLSWILSCTRPRMVASILLLLLALDIIHGGKNSGFVIPDGHDTMEWKDPRRGIVQDLVINAMVFSFAPGFPFFKPVTICILNVYDEVWKPSSGVGFWNHSTLVCGIVTLDLNYTWSASPNG